MSSDVGDGQAHSQKDLPIILAGRGAGAVSPGSPSQVRGATPHEPLRVCCMKTFDVTMDKYNDSTGTISDLPG